MTSLKNSELEDKIKLAKDGHYYIKVVEIDGKFKTSTISLKGADRMFQKNEDFIYIPKLRHAGLYHVILNYLISKDYDEEKTRKILEDAYTIDNYTEKQAWYDTEVAKIPKGAIRKAPEMNMSVDYILNCGKKLSSYKYDINAPPKSPVPMTPKASAVGGKKNLEMRLEELRVNEVLDITNFNPSTKKGIKRMKFNVKSVKHPVGSTGDLKRIFYDFNKPVEIGVLALIFLGYKKDKAIKIMEDPLHTSSHDPTLIMIE
jgi:hypothetical protein